VRIAVASGKGGTGKTTVALNLFRHFSRRDPGRVLLADCDVEEPNAALFLKDLVPVRELPVRQEIPVIDSTRCNFCRKCTEYCEFGAITVLPPARFAEINPSLCHSCGACSIACDRDAIWVKDHDIGILRSYRTTFGSVLMEGELRIGSAMQTAVIRSLKRAIPDQYEIILMDAPPGTSCPVVETVSDADYVMLVTEPTPFGLHDLRLMVDLMREMDKSFGVVINKVSGRYPDTWRYLEKEGIDILGEIPFDRNYAAGYATGNLFDHIPGDIDRAYENLLMRMEYIPTSE
jgi:MinD superfamily P-loop ATPase